MKKPPSWVLVVILLLVFPPVGVFLLYKRLSFGQDLQKQASLLLLFGIVLTVISLGGMAKSGYAFMHFVIGIIMLVMWHKRKKLASRCDTYRSLVYQQHICSLEHIASQLGIRYESVVSDFNNLLTLGQFPGARIDYQNRMLIVPGSVYPPDCSAAYSGVDQVVEQVTGAVSQVVSSVNQAVGQVVNTVQPQREQIVTVQCKSCGANNRVSTTAGGECEYCGSPLRSD